jgi:hypothetical protein
MKTHKLNSRGIGYSNYLHVSVGDIIKTNCWMYQKPEEVEKTVRITKIIDRRLGKINGGTFQQSPLIEGININSNKKEFFDASLVAEIVERPKYVAKKKENIYKNNKLCFDKKGTSKLTRSKYGWTDLLEMALGELNIKIEVPFSHSRFEALWEKNKKPGFCTEGIKYKKFKKFVQCNVSKILVPVKVQDARLTAREKQQEEDYWKMIEEEEDGLRRY